MSIATTESFCSFEGVDLVKAGTWDASTGTATITRADLAAAAAASHALPDIPLKLGHTDPRFDGGPALGKVTNLRLVDGGNTLVGDLVDVPNWLGDQLPTAYPQRSIEGVFNLATNGVTYRFALTALALLGEHWPAVTNLESLRALCSAEGAPQ